VKVHIINLDPEDDHASVRDKISRARAQKAVLVWPRRGRPIDRQLDLAIIQRHAGRLSIEIGLVTFDPEIIAHADRLQIPVFDSLEDLPPGTWNKPMEVESLRRERPALTELREAREASDGTLVHLSERGRWVAVGISIVATLAIVISILPSAEIVMDPAGSPIEEELVLWIDPQPSSASSRIPGQAVSAEISGSKRVNTSGRVRLPLEVASGEIEVTNLTGEEITVPAGTGLRAGEIRFLTSDEGQLDASEGSTALVSVVAAEPGASGNVAAGTIDSVEGSLGFLIAVTNPEPTRGGRDRATAAVGMKDFDVLRQELETELMEAAESALEVQLDRGYELIPGSVRITEVTDESFDFGLGDASESLGLSLTFVVEGLGYSVPLTLAAAEQELLSMLPSDRLLIPNSLSLEAIDAVPDWPAMEVQFAAEGITVKTLDYDLLRRSVLGNPKEQAADRLEDIFGLNEAPQIRTSPNWMPWVPWLGMRIDVKWAWESA
jgi:hypothetical protein